MKNNYILLFLIIILIFSTSFSNASKININKNEIQNNTNFTEKTNVDSLSKFKNPCDKDILYPLSTNPVIVEKGKNFDIIIKTNSFDNIFVYISTAYEPVVDEIDLLVNNVEEINDEYHLNVFVPFDTPNELYNLTVIIQRDNNYKTYSRPRAVNVVEKIDDDFNFIHITDLHAGDPRGFLESIRETLGFRSIKKCIEEINLLKPDFVLISGDLVFGQIYPFEYNCEYKKCFEIIQMFDVPTYVSPGNHDGYRRILEDGLVFWQKYFGPLYYSFDYGDYHFQSINSYDMPALMRFTFLFIPLNWGGSISDSQLSWIEDDLEENTDKNMTFMFMHHNPIWDTKSDSLIKMGYKNRRNLLDLIDEYNVDIVLAGHVHYDSVNTVNDTIYITTTTPESEIRVEDGYWGYRLVEIEDDEIKSFNYKDPKYSIPSYQIGYEHVSPFEIKITNNLDEDITAHVKFVVPRGFYLVQYGYQEGYRNNHVLSEIYAYATIEANSEKNIKIIEIFIE